MYYKFLVYFLAAYLPFYLPIRILYSGLFVYLPDIIAGVLFLLYLIFKLVIKRFSFDRLGSYLGLKLEDSVLQHLSEERKKEHSFQMIKVYLMFLVKVIIVVIVVRLLFLNNDIVCVFLEMLMVTN